MPEILKQIENEIVIILQKQLNEISLSKIKLLQISYSLIKANKFINKRSIYYQAVPIFKSQSRVDTLLTYYMKKFGCEMKCLNVKAGLKGIFYGNLEFVFQNNERISLKGHCLIPDMGNIVNVEHKYSLIVVVEKETVMSRVKNEEFLTICGKGYPCTNTLKLLQKLEPKVQVICMTDFDPHGLQIFLTYRKTIKEIKRIGLSSEDILRYRINRNECIQLKDREIKMIKEIKKKVEGYLIEEIDFMEGMGMKIELEAVMNQVNFDIMKYLKIKGIEYG